MTDALSDPPRSVVFAPDSFKGTVSAADAARLLADGWHAVDPAAVAVLRPMADGGEGTLDAFATAIPGARVVPVRVAAPVGAGQVDATWLLLPPEPGLPRGTAVVELASTAGIELLGADLDPWNADTRGFGEAIVAALDHGVDRLILAIGSSASTDAGTGMLRALGATFSGEPGVRGARGLEAVTGIDLSGLRALPRGGAVVLTDVTNPLTGAEGAAAVFGPQKGFARSEIAVVDALLARVAAFVDVDASTPGAGAAGGTGLALLAWGARLVPGAGAVAELIGLADAVTSASLVVTGEGSYDGQSARGKAPAHVSTAAGESGVPVALVAGRVEGGDLASFAHVVSLTELAGSPRAARGDARVWLRRAGAELARRSLRVSDPGGTPRSV